MTAVPNPAPDVEIAVIGGGAVGLAIARAAALSGRSVAVFERNGKLGQETSSRSSEVAHAGLYYPPRSLKARLCVEGHGIAADGMRAFQIAEFDQLMPHEAWITVCDEQVAFAFLHVNAGR